MVASVQRIRNPTTSPIRPESVDQKKGANSRQPATRVKHTPNSIESANEIV
jgi:hypothetical protein